MPFTLSHAVLAPPLARLSQNFLPVAALAIGCMLPDLYRLFTTQEGGFSHSWQALWYPNLMIGIGFCVLWYWLYRPVLYQLFDLEDPLPIFNFLDALKFGLGCLIALVIGNALHILWDGFTHVDDRTLILHEFLSQPIEFLGQSTFLHIILQLLSSFIGMLLLIWMLWRYKSQHQHAFRTPIYLKSIIGVILLMSLFAGLWYGQNNLRYFSSATEYHFAYYFLGHAFNEFSQGFLVCSCLCFCLLLILQKLWNFDSV